MPLKEKKPASAAVRDPDRTRRRILDAALKEFSKGGFAGARVGAIARRAKVNKRMLYHYFTDKEGLFRAVLRHKISERMTRIESQTAHNDGISNVVIWFRHNCCDTDWMRLLAWESLQTTNDAVLDEAERRRLVRQAAVHIRKKQAAGILRKDVSADFLQLAKVSLSMFPLALPQVARLITGRAPQDVKFQRDYARFLETISAAFRPSTVARK